MNRISVGQTVAFAYRFTFGHIGTVIGLIWIPLLVFCIGQFFFMNYYVKTILAVGTGASPAALGPLLLSLIGFLLTALLVSALISAAVTRQAMGLRTGPAIVYFSFGTAEFNLFVSLIAVGLVLIVVTIGTAILVRVLLMAANSAIKAGQLPAQQGNLILLLAQDVGQLILLGVLGFVGARLTFVLAPVTISEGRIDLIRAWTLTKGNFWRIFAIGAAVLLPIAVVGGMGEVAILGPAYFAEQLAPATDQAAATARAMMQLQTMLAHEPELLGLGLILGPFIYGLMYSAGAFAYRQLTASAPAALAPNGGV